MRQSLLAKIEEIADNLSHAFSHREVGLYTGNAGISLFFFYYARYKNVKTFHKKAAEIVDNIYAQIEEVPQPLISLCSGIAGVGWLLDHLCRQRFIYADPEEVLSDIDGYVYQSALKELNQGHYDFLHGAMGVVFYLVKRNRWDYLKDLVSALNDIAIWDEGCAKWRSKLRHLKGAFGFNISLSHGSSAIAIILCKFLKIIPENETAKRLLQGTIGYILNQEIPVAQYGCYFPAFSIESQPELTKTRLGWCYGDLGVALAIWESGQQLQNQAWTNKGMKVLLHAARRRGLSENLVMDAGICHGTAGLAQIFNRLYRRTKRIDFMKAADYWCKETLRMAKFEDGLAGYKTWYSPEYGGWKCKDSLLEGIAGIGLSLLSFVAPEDPVWDECLLLS